MKRAPFWIVAALLAVGATAVTLWLVPAETDTPDASAQRDARTGRGGGFRSRRVVPVQRNAPREEAPHPRIAALAPGIAQMVRDMGCGHLIVGRHGSDDWSDQSIPVCNDQQSIDYEHLIAANPTHVFLQWGERKLPERLESLARERGWMLRNVPLLTLDDVGHAVYSIHGAFSTMELDALSSEDPGLSSPREPGERRNRTVGRAIEQAPFSLSQQLERSFAPDVSLAGIGRVLLLYQGAGEGGGARPAALGPGSYSHDILLRIGGRSATPKGKQFMELDAEDIARLSPDAIVIVRPRKAGTSAAAPTPDDLVRSLGAVARLDVPAIKSGRIALIDDTMALVPGTNLTEFADRLRAILKGWAAEAPVAAPAR